MAMRITNLRREDRGELLRLAADIHWETADRPDAELYYEVPSEFANRIALGGEAFVTAATLPAMRLNEQRVAIEGQICPELLEGLDIAMHWLARWNRDRHVVALEASAGCAHSLSSDGPRAAASLMSGGIDSLAVLKHNHGQYPPGHPSRITKCLVYRGIWGVEREERDDTMDRLRKAQADLLPVARSADVELIPIFTNFQNLSDGDIRFWQYEFQGAALASAAHLFQPSISSLSVPGSWTVEHMRPWGSHPLLDPNYGSHDLRIYHGLVLWSRMAKTAAVAQWDEALQALRVCNRDAEGDINCSKCEKCKRTMLTLVALDALSKTKAFKYQDLEPSVLDGVFVPYRHMEGDYLEIAAKLRQAERDDLAEAMERRIRPSRAMRARKRMGKSLRKADNRYLEGRVFKWRTDRRTRTKQTQAAP